MLISSAHRLPPPERERCCKSRAQRVEAATAAGARLARAGAWTMSLSACVAGTEPMGGLRGWRHLGSRHQGSDDGDMCVGERGRGRE
jgi:hypothetical protein